MTRRAIDVNTPEPGYYELYRVPRSKGGVPLPCSIWWEYGDHEPCEGCDGSGKIDGATCEHCDGAGYFLMSDDILRATIVNEPTNAFELWPKVAKYPISKEKYDERMEDREWIENHAPVDHQERDPTSPVDLNKSDPAF